MFTGLLLGFAFLAKMLQAFLVVPGFALAYLWARAPAGQADLAACSLGAARSSSARAGGSWRS